MPNPFDALAEEIGGVPLTRACAHMATQAVEEALAYCGQAPSKTDLMVRVASTLGTDLLLTRAALWKMAEALAAKAEFSDRVSCELLARVAELEQAKARIAELEEQDSPAVLSPEQLAERDRVTAEIVAELEAQAGQ